MKLKIAFGMSLDGAVWSKSEASIGEIVCGPKTMLQLLETRLGRSGREIAPSARVSWYERKVRQAMDPWYRHSFERDSWGVTVRLLKMRDELVMMGWKGTSNPDSVRVSALAKIESNRQYDEVARKYAGRLVYKQSIERKTGGRVLAAILHLPVCGVCLECEL